MTSHFKFEFQSSKSFSFIICNHEGKLQMNKDVEEKADTLPTVSSMLEYFSLQSLAVTPFALMNCFFCKIENNL